MFNPTEDLIMLDSNQDQQVIKEFFNTDIDYQFYHDRARSLRSEAAWGFLHGLFTQQKTSSMKRQGLNDWMETAVAGIRCRIRPCPQA